MKILITGARGTIGSKLSEALSGDHELRLLSRRPVADDGQWWQVDVRDLDALCKACDGVDTIVHLAIATGYEGDHEDDAFNAERFDTNVKGTYNVFEAARRAGVSRVVHTSSLTVVWGYRAPSQVDGDAPPRPIGTYALTKCLAEDIAQHYAATYGISVPCLRIPKPIDIDDSDTKKAPILPQWIAFPDLVQAYKLALVADIKGFEVVTVVGESTKRRWDLSRAQQILGYEPSIRLEDLGYTLRDEPTDYDQAGVVWGDNKTEKS
jgi:uronate dehydrogenase